MSGLLRKRCRSGPLHSRVTKTDQRSSLHLSAPLNAIPTRMKTHRGPQRKRQQAWSRLLPLDGSRPLLALFEVLFPQSIQIRLLPVCFVKPCNTCIILTLAEVSVKAGKFFSCTPWKRQAQHEIIKAFTPKMSCALSAVIAGSNADKRLNLSGVTALISLMVQLRQMSGGVLL